MAETIHPDYPEFIKLPYKLAHYASRDDRRIKKLLQEQVAEHKNNLKKKPATKKVEQKKPDQRTAKKK